MGASTTPALSHGRKSTAAAVGTTGSVGDTADKKERERLASSSIADGDRESTVNDAESTAAHRAGLGDPENTKRKRKKKAGGVDMLEPPQMPTSERGNDDTQSSHLKKKDKKKRKALTAETNNSDDLPPPPPESAPSTIPSPATASRSAVVAAPAAASSSLPWKAIDAAAIAASAITAAEKERVRALSKMASIPAWMQRGKIIHNTIGIPTAPSTPNVPSASLSTGRKPKSAPSKPEEDRGCELKAEAELYPLSIFKLHPLVHRTLSDMGISSLFPVQKEVIPVIMKAHLVSDVCVSAPTGSGKTLTYVVPIVQVSRSRITHFCLRSFPFPSLPYSYPKPAVCSRCCIA